MTRRGFIAACICAAIALVNDDDEEDELHG